MVVGEGGGCEEDVRCGIVRFNHSALLWVSLARARGNGVAKADDAMRSGWPKSAVAKSSTKGSMGFVDWNIFLQCWQ